MVCVHAQHVSGLVKYMVNGANHHLPLPMTAARIRSEAASQPFDSAVNHLIEEAVHCIQTAKRSNQTVLAELVVYLWRF